MAEINRKYWDEQDNIRLDLLEEIKDVMTKEMQYGYLGLFFSRNFVGDDTPMIWTKANVGIFICREHSYFEVLGLNFDEQEYLLKWYNNIAKLMSSY